MGNCCSRRRGIPSPRARVIDPDEIVTEREMHQISLKISNKKRRTLARALDLSEGKIQQIEESCYLNQLDDADVIYEILDEWKNTKGSEATRKFLSVALNEVGLANILQEVLTPTKQTSKEEKKQENIERKPFLFPSDQHSSVGINKVQNTSFIEQKSLMTHLGTIPSSSKGNTLIRVQLQIQSNQIKVYRDVELPQVNWTDRILPLEELYVQLELLKTAGDCEGNKAEPIQVKQLFNKIKEDVPVRILIEGGPGYGKTTLCYKLLNDWARNRSYIRSKFKMVFLFELRYFNENDSIEEIFRKECETVGVNGDDASNCIKTYQNETLLILDGFDELNNEGKIKIFPLIQKKIYPTMSVVVTSRRGMFQMEGKNEIMEERVLQRADENVIINRLWNKRVLIKGVSTDQIAQFMRKYFDKSLQDFELKIDSIVTEEMKEVLECPLCLILLAMILEEKSLENVNSKTKLYKEFFNFIIRRNLIREKKVSDEEEVDIFNELSDYSELIQSLNQFGRLAIECLGENKLMFQEKELSAYCKDKFFFQLGFLTKIPKMQGKRKENFYQAIHKSFLEFMAAFALWNLFKSDEDQFKMEIEKLGNKGLKPTNDSLFYLFLGGLLNNRASVLFQCLTRYALWFNIESLCFTNILLEIEDIHSFFPSFRPILDAFIPSYYSNVYNVWLTKDYSQSEIQSLILKYSNDQRLINVLECDSSFSFTLSHVVYVECFYLYLSKEIFKISPNEDKTVIKCKKMICEFSQLFEVGKWYDFVSLLNSIQSEHLLLSFVSKSNGINSLVLELFYKELIEGRWKHKNIDRLRFHLNESDDLSSLSLLTELLKENRIKDGFYLRIEGVWRRTKKENDILQSKTEELFHAVIESKTIKEFIVSNDDSNFSPDFNFNLCIKSQLMSIYFQGFLNVYNSDDQKIEKYLFEEVRVDLVKKMELNFIQNIQDIKYLECDINSFSSMFEMDWRGVKEVEELELIIYSTHEQILYLNSVSQLTNLQVLSFNVDFFKTVPSESQLIFINLFSSLHLRICQFMGIQNIISFSIFMDVLMKGLESKEKKEHYSIISLNDQHEGKNFHFQELVIDFDLRDIDFNDLKKCNGIQCIQSMLRKKHLKQFCWVDDYYYNIIKSDQLESLFPWNNNFKISREVNGMNPNNSRQSKFTYRWSLLRERYCIQFLDKNIFTY